MKNRLGLTLLVAAAWLPLVATTRAELLIYEPFDYAPGPLDGQNGGTGFGGPWNVLSEFTFEVVQMDAPLQYAVPGGATVDGGKQALRFGNDEFGVTLDNELEALSREFAEVYEGNELYISYLYRYDPEGYIDVNDFVVWWFNDDTGPQLGLKGEGGDGSSTDDITGRVNNQYQSPQQVFVPDVDISDEAGTMGADFLIVGKLARADYSDDPDDYDEFSIWVNPGADEANSPHAVATGVPDSLLVTSLERLGMRAFNQEELDAMYWDEMRIGTTWDDVVNPGGGLPALRAGDANMDLKFDQLDLVQVQIAAKYLTGQAATWGEGDWNGAPGGSPGNPPAGDNRFDQLDIIAALSADIYLQGPYAAIQTGGTSVDAHDVDLIYVQVPEPSTLVLLVLALVGAWGIPRRHR